MVGAPCLTNILSNSSKGRYGKRCTKTVRNSAIKSIGSSMPAKALELAHIMGTMIIAEL